MILKDIKDELEASVLVGQESLNLEVKMVCGADLLSDVLAFTKSGSLFLTGLTHPQVIRTAEIAEIAAICFVRGRQPSCTALPMYESCGRLYRCGLGGCSQVAEEQ
jgi:hypothetical protein